MKGHLKTRGSALIFILIAIALLGGLTVVLSRTSSNTEETGASERDVVIASEIIRDSEYIKSIVDRMLLSGCSINELDFSSEEYVLQMAWPIQGAGFGNANPNAPADKRCHFFYPEGGGQSLGELLPPKDVGGVPYIKNYEFTGQIRSQHHGQLSKFELTINTSIESKSLCLAINKLLGITDPSGEPWLLTGSNNPNLFTGSFDDQLPVFQTVPWPSPDTRMNGKKGICISQPDADPPEHYLYYYVLYAR